jgi:hypothetical protein
VTSEADHKRKLVAEINALRGGRARRVEDRFAVGVLDLILKPPNLPLVLAEGKLIEGHKFGPTERQWIEGNRWLVAGVGVVLIGWKNGMMSISPWVSQADRRECWTGLDRAETLMEYLRNGRENQRAV